LFRYHADATHEWTVPDGFDGIEQRGGWNRLLATEWAMLQFESDEFYRRVTMGESQYLKLAQQHQTQPQSFYLLLDRGPDQYGAPLLLQLALMLVLCRRAREQNLPLHVGMFQEPGQWVVATNDSLEHLLHPYLSHARLTTTMVEAWEQTMKEQAMKERVIDPQGIWLVTNPAPDRPFKFGQAILIDADPDPQGQINLMFQPRRQRLQFRLPDDDAALRLLRRPFIRSATLLPPPKSLNLKAFQLHPLSRKCFFYDPPHLLTFYLPKKVVVNSSQLKSYCYPIQNHETLVGVWQMKSTTALVTVEDANLYCTGFFKQAKITIPRAQLPPALQVPKAESPPPLAYVLRESYGASIIIQDGDRQGFMLQFQKTESQPTFRFCTALALGPMHWCHLQEQSLFFTDGENTLYQLRCNSTPIAFDCAHPIHGLVQRYNRLNSLYYVDVFPLMKTPEGSWVQDALQIFELEAEDRPIGSDRHRLVIQRRNRQIWELPQGPKRGPKQDPKGEGPVQGRLILEEPQMIRHAIYQGANQWVVYQTDTLFKVYSLELKTAILTLELENLGSQRYTP
jgi:hypothetical protein